MGIELSQEEALKILSGLELTAYQLKELASEVGSHEDKFNLLQSRIVEIQQTIALLNASKARLDNAVSLLPEYYAKVDRVVEALARMHSNMDSIKNQAWGGFLSAIAMTLMGWAVIGFQKPAKSATIDAPIDVELLSFFDEKPTFRLHPQRSTK